MDLWLIGWQAEVTRQQIENIRLDEAGRREELQVQLQLRTDQQAEELQRAREQQVEELKRIQERQAAAEAELAAREERLRRAEKVWIVETEIALC
jgi:uncharacterized protein YPO0396